MKDIAFTTNDIADELENVINEAKPDEVILLPAGRFLLGRKVKVKGKKNLILQGNDTILVTPFSATEGFSTYKGAFDFTDCHGLTLENFVFDTTENVNSAGVVTKVDAETCTFEVELFADCALDGHQVIRAMNSMDADGSPDYLLANYNDTPYELLDKKTARIKCDEALKGSLERLPIGEKICFRHALGNFRVLENSAITFHNCENIVINDITVHSSAGYMIVVFPRCHNMTINRYRVVCPEGSNRLMASNIDAIHLLGLSGKLIMKDCYFDGLGDDAVNIHSTAGTISSIVGNTVKLTNGRFSIPLETDWCKEGDVIAVYTKDFVCKGHLEVKNYKDSAMVVKLLDGSYEIGDIVGNTAFYAETEIIGCTVRNSRARGFLLQTENIKISNCKFFGISLSAILFAPDIKVWHEVGPIKNAVIEDCLIEKSPASKEGNVLGSIVVNTSHSYFPETIDIVHQWIDIKNNRFKKLSGDAVFITSSNGVTIENNVIESIEDAERDINKRFKLLHCINVNMTGNSFI